MTEDEAKAAKEQRAPVRMNGRTTIWLISTLLRKPDGTTTASLRQPGVSALRGYRRYHVSLNRLELALA